MRSTRAGLITEAEREKMYLTGLPTTKSSSNVYVDNADTYIYIYALYTLYICTIHIDKMCGC